MSASARSTAASVLGEYSGTIRVTAQAYDNCGPGATRRNAGTGTFDFPVEVIVSEVADDGDFAESNPFTLAVFAQGATEGAIVLRSATVLTTPSSRPLLVQYWELVFRDGQLTGELTDDHIDTAGTYNQYNGFVNRVCRPEIVPLAIPLAIRPGATMSGRLDGSQVTLEVSGRTFDDTREFVASLVANRTS